MALKRTVSKKPTKDKEKDLMDAISGIQTDIARLRQQETFLSAQLLNLRISPFKVGDYCMAEVNAGKTKKVQKCLLENEGGTLYLRPVKNDGELSGRHFSLVPVSGKTYSDYLKPVEE